MTLPLQDLLTQLSKTVTNWWLVEPGGNYGDRLIFVGAEKLFRELGLRYTAMTAEEFYQTKEPGGAGIYIHGGGGYNSWGKGVQLKLLEHSIELNPRVVVQGPCTLELDSETVRLRIEEALSRKNTELPIHFYAREHGSLAELEKCFGDRLKIYLDHDTALVLTKDDITTSYGQLQEKYLLQAIRSDDEAVSDGLYPLDQGITIDPAYYALNFAHWVRLHLYAREVISNRTHSTILSSILGKRVTMLAGKYHKNRSIWEYSLKARGVKWLDNDALVHPNLRFRHLPDKLRHSYKLNRFVDRLRGVPQA